MLVLESITQRLIVTALGAVLVFAAAGCGENESARPATPKPELGGDFSPTIAEVGDIQITRAYFDYRYENLPPHDKARYSGEGWEQRFLDKLIEEIVVSEAADREQYDMIREVEWRLDMARRSILAKAYYERNFQELLEVPEEELRDYYDRHPESFRTLGRAFASHIMSTSKEKIDAAYAELQSGVPFAAVAAKYSEDEVTRDDGGALGWFNPDGFVLGMGFNAEFTRVAFGLDPHTTSSPQRIGDRWHIIRLGAKAGEQPQPYEEARERIERKLRPVIGRERFENFVREQKQQLGVRGFGEFQGETRTADQLYQLAAETANVSARIDYYESLVNLYPDHERADDSLFMMGFLSSEELGEAATAMRALRRLQREYPESEFVEQADWLMQNLGSTSGAQGAAGPANAADAAESLRERQ